MLRFRAFDFTLICFHIEQLQGDCLFDDRAPDAETKESEWRESLVVRLGALKIYAEKLGLDSTVGQCERLMRQAREGIKVEPLCYLLRDLEGTVVRELKKPVFLALRPDLAELYQEEDLGHVGLEVIRTFGESTHDIAEARRCFALERWDACVHHLMRAIEQAIRKWAKDLRLRTTLPLDLENIEQILQAADSKYKEIKQRKKNRKRDKDLTYVAETSGHFGFIKDAWRNHAAHGRERYDERRAKNLMVHVEAFMRLLATRRTPIT